MNPKCKPHGNINPDADWIKNVVSSIKQGIGLIVGLISNEQTIIKLVLTKH